MTEDSDTKQNTTGDDNVQINSAGDTIAAIGDGSIAAGRDVIINQGNDELLLEKIIENTPQPLPPSNLDETAKDIKPDWPIENNNSQAAKTQKIIDSTLSNLTEDDLRDKIRSLLMSKRK